MSIRRPLIGLILSALVVSACASSTPSPTRSAAASPSPDSSGAAGSLVGPTWVVSTIGGSDTVATARPMMTFGADGQVTGTGGCNSYGGPYRLDGAAIDVGDLASTMMLCQDQSIGTQETAFFAALGGAQTWRIDEAGNLLLNGVSEIVATQRPVEPSASGAAALVGSWNLTQMGPTADFAHLQPTIEFTADGGVSGFAGCNTFTGSYTTDGSTLTLTPLATTKMACQRPGSAVESDYLGALSGVTGWAIQPDGRLFLDGAIPLQYARG
jgi:heat shock protein HslJ